MKRLTLLTFVTRALFALVIVFLSAPCRADEPATAAVRRLEVLKKIEKERLVLFGRRDDLLKKVAVVENEIKVANGQLVEVVSGMSVLSDRIQKLNEELAPLNRNSPQYRQTNEQVFQLTNERDGLNAKGQGIIATIAGLKEHVAQGEQAMSELYAEANQLRKEWIDLADPFGKFSRREHEEAIRTFTEWIVLDGQNSAAFFARGIAYWQLGKLDKAYADFDRAYQLGQQFGPLSLAARGAIQHALGKKKEGLADLGKASKADKAEGLIHLLLAKVHLSDGKYSLAVNELKIAGQLNAQDAAVYQQMAYVFGACSQTGIRNSKKAIEAGRSACRITADRDWSSYDAFAVACAEAGNFDEAVKLEDKAIKLSTEENQETCIQHQKLFADKLPLRIDFTAKQSAPAK
jgi:tetratricopeptide (TPR) repeat protein